MEMRLGRENRRMYTEFWGRESPERSIWNSEWTWGRNIKMQLTEIGFEDGKCMKLLTIVSCVGIRY